MQATLIYILATNTMFKHLFYTAFIACLVSVPTVSARKIADWPYQKLLDDADVVVIAYAGSTTPNGRTWEEEHFEQKHFKGVDTTIQVITSLKGKPPRVLTLRHFVYTKNHAVFNDGPGLVSFITDPMSVEISFPEQTQPDHELKGLTRISKPQYLLFLKRVGDGEFEPISGQLDADLSARALFELKTFDP